MSNPLIGMLLVQRGVLKQEQVDSILQIQQNESKPFGKLAHELYGVPEHDIWSAWARQVGHYCQHVDLACEPNDPTALEIISAAEAWRNHILPLRYEDATLIVATTVTDLPEASALLQNRTPAGVRFVIPDRRQLEQFIIERFGIVAVESESA